MAKRPWLQFHLSTAIVLMFVAGGLLWANMKPNAQAYVEASWHVGTSAEVHRVELWVTRGFPIPWLFRSIHDVGGRSPGPAVNGPVVTDFPATDEERAIAARIPELSGAVLWGGLVTDVVVAVATLFVVGVAMEWVTRRTRRG